MMGRYTFYGDYRTRGHARTATIAGTVVHFRQGNPANAWLEAYGTYVAYFTADTAFHVLCGKASFANFYAEKPGGLCQIRRNRAGNADLCAVAAKSALPTDEVSDRKSSIATHKKARRTHLDAIVAVSTLIDKKRFGKAPWRTKGGRP